jgi:hypothetical protein
MNFWQRCLLTSSRDFRWSRLLNRKRGQSQRPDAALRRFPFLGAHGGARERRILYKRNRRKNAMPDLAIFEPRTTRVLFVQFCNRHVRATRFQTYHVTRFNLHIVYPKRLAVSCARVLPAAKSIRVRVRNAAIKSLRASASKVPDGVLRHRLPDQFNIDAQPVRC